MADRFLTRLYIARGGWPVFPYRCVVESDRCCCGERLSGDSYRAAPTLEAMNEIYTTKQIADPDHFGKRAGSAKFRVPLILEDTYEYIIKFSRNISLVGAGDLEVGSRFITRQ